MLQNDRCGSWLWAERIFFLQVPMAVEKVPRFLQSARYGQAERNRPERYLRNALSRIALKPRSNRHVREREIERRSNSFRCMLRHETSRTDSHGYCKHDVILGSAYRCNKFKLELTFLWPAQLQKS
jgi:hypothetical protein